MSGILAPLLAVLSAAFYGAMFLLTQLGLRAGRVNATQAMFINLATANLVLLIPVAMLLAKGNLAVNWLGFFYFFLAGLLAPLAGRSMNFLSIQRIGATRGSTLSSSESLFAAVIAYLVLGQKVSAVTSIGIVIIVVGVSLFVREILGDRGGRPDSGLVSQPATRDRVVAGVTLGLLSGVLFAGAGVFRQLGLYAIPSAIFGTMTGTLVALTATSVSLVTSGQLRGSLRARRSDLLALSGSGLAGTLGMVAFLMALQTGKAIAISTALKNTGPLFTYALGLIFLARHEKFTLRIGLLISVVVAGGVLVAVGRI